MQTLSGYLEINGARLYYEEAGTGDAVILLHGFSLDARCWDGQFEPLARHYRVVRYDIRGFGRSSLPHGAPYSHAGDLGELLNRLGAETPVLIGLSMGGAIAVDFALTHPLSVRALVLVGSTLGGYRWSDEESSFYREVIRRAREDGIELGRQHWLRDPLFAAPMEQPEAAAMLTEMIAGYSGWHWLNRDPEQSPEPRAIQRLGEIPVPALVVVGEHDIPDIQGMARALAGGISGARESVIGGAGHLSCMEAPLELNRVVLEFLENLN